MLSRIFGFIVLIGFCIYLSYRFWQIGYWVGGPVVAASVCLSLLLFGAVGLWWAMRPDKSRAAAAKSVTASRNGAPKNGASPH